MHTQKLEIINRKGYKLSARLELPVDREPSAYAILAHCFTCGKNLTSLRTLSRALSVKGIAVVRFDFTGIGESEGEFAEKEFSANVHDLLDVAEFLKKNYAAPSLLIGHSLGGAAVLLAAGQLDSVKGIITIGAPASSDHAVHLFKESLQTIHQEGKGHVNIGGREFIISDDFVESLNGHNMEEVIGHIKKGLLIFHSPQDEIVGIENAAAIYKAAHHPKSFISLDGADHLLSNKDDAIYVGEMIATWASRYLEISEKETIETDLKVAVRTGSSYTTEVRAGHHGLLVDEPKQLGGNDLGPTPYDLVAAGLGSCTSITLRMYANRKKWDLEEVIVHLQHKKIHAQDCEDCEQETAKLDKIERWIELRGNLDEKQRKRLIQIADKCPVHKTLHAGIEVVTKEKLKP